jgi:hypothetical protein
VDPDGFLGEASHGESLQGSTSRESHVSHSVLDKGVGQIDMDYIEGHALGFVNGCRPRKIKRELGASSYDGRVVGRVEVVVVKTMLHVPWSL